SFGVIVDQAGISRVNNYSSSDLPQTKVLELQLPHRLTSGMLFHGGSSIFIQSDGEHNDDERSKSRKYSHGTGSDSLTPSPDNDDAGGKPLLFWEEKSFSKGATYLRYMSPFRHIGTVSPQRRPCSASLARPVRSSQL